jgi:hypothetical protein
LAARLEWRKYEVDREVEREMRERAIGEGQHDAREFQIRSEGGLET